eukprot:ANDGO_05945.mRNA.1 hypothetical protein DDB_G0280265
MELYGATKRLEIGALRASDAPAMFSYRSHPSVSQYQYWLPRSLRDVDQFIQDNSEPVNLMNPGWYQLALRCASSLSSLPPSSVSSSASSFSCDGELIGDIGIHVIEDVPDCSKVELGISIAPHWQKKGLALEAMHWIITELFNRHKKRLVTVSIDPRNASSLALFLRLGFKERHRSYRSILMRGEWVDDLILELLPNDFSCSPIACNTVLVTNDAPPGSVVCKNIGDVIK